MEISAKELRGSPGKYIEQAVRGTDVVITLRGKRVARLVPYAEHPDCVAESGKHASRDEISGLWADRTDISNVSTYLRSLREGSLLTSSRA